MRLLLFFCLMRLVGATELHEEVLNKQQVLQNMHTVYEGVLQGRYGQDYQALAAQMMDVKAVDQCVDYMVTTSLDPDLDKDNLRLAAYIGFFSFLRHKKNQYGRMKHVGSTLMSAFDKEKEAHIRSWSSETVQVINRLGRSFFKANYTFVMTEDGLFSMELWLRRFFEDEYLLSVPKDMGLKTNMEAHSYFKGLLDVVIWHDLNGHGTSISKISKTLKEKGVFDALGCRIKDLLDHAKEANKQAIILVLFYLFHEGGALPSQLDINSGFEKIKPFLFNVQKPEEYKAFSPVQAAQDIQSDFAQLVYQEYCRRNDSFIIGSYTKENSKALCGAILYQWYQDFIAQECADVEALLVSCG